MRLTIAYFKIKKRNLVLINIDTYQRETLSERPIRQPLNVCLLSFHYIFCVLPTVMWQYFHIFWVKIMQTVKYLSS